MFCANCGARQHEGAAFCDQCGSRISAPSVAAGQPVPPPAPPYVPAPPVPPYPPVPPVPQYAPVPQAAAGNVPTYMLQAILVTLFCCIPLGIVAIVKANAVQGALARGDVRAAVEASNAAKTLCWISFGIGIVLAFIGVLSGAAGA